MILRGEQNASNDQNEFALEEQHKVARFVFQVEGFLRELEVRPDIGADWVVDSHGDYGRNNITCVSIAQALQARVSGENVGLWAEPSAVERIVNCCHNEGSQS